MRAIRSAGPGYRCWVGGLAVLGCAAFSFGVSARSASALSLHWSRPIRVDSVRIGGHLYSQALGALSCPSVSLCAGLDVSGNVVTSTNPGAGAKAAWRKKSLEHSGNGQFFNGLSCASTSLCLAVDQRGNVFTSTGPAAAHSTRWARKQLRSGPLATVSCASASLCIAADMAGDILSSTDPTDGTKARWTSSIGQPDHNPTYGASASCPSVALCELGNGDGNLVGSTDPGGGPFANWAIKNIEGNPFTTSSASPLSGISCPTVSLCVAVDLEGNVLTSTDPAQGGGARWTLKNVLGRGFSGGYFHSFEGISCPSTSLCVGVGDHGQTAEVAGSGDPAAGSKATWTVHRVVDQNSQLQYVSCPSTRLCIAANLGGEVLVGRR